MNLKAASVLHTLAEGEISALHGQIGWSSNYTFLITVTGEDDIEALAVYKPQRGERPLWDFPQGTLCYREVAAYRVSEALGWHIVPPTVLREGPHGVGSVQLFIYHDPEVTYFTLDDQMAHRLRYFAAFDALANNADRKGGHFILDDEDHLWGIDHGLTFNAAPKLRTVLWDFAGEPVPDAILSDLQALLDAHTDLQDLLTPNEIEMTTRRIQNLLETQTYPQPSPGRNYPWPPV